MRERERERDRQTDRQTDRYIHNIICRYIYLYNLLFIHRAANGGQIKPYVHAEGIYIRKKLTPEEGSCAENVGNI